MAGASLNTEDRLSRYVVRARRGEEIVLFNTVTKASLPPDAHLRELRGGCFLKGQEGEALERFLFARRRTLTLTLVVTWQCNLRCTHCTVLDRLASEETRRIDVEALIDFIERYLAHSPEIEELKITFLGGEPLLVPGLCREVIERTRPLAPVVRYDTTTNLACSLGTPELALLHDLDDIIVSLDGLEDQHNAQRKPFRAQFNPFERTFGNLEKLVSDGLAERLYVQGAIRDEFATMESFQDFQRELMRLGVRYDRIAFETIHPAKHKMKAQESYLSALKTPHLRADACCKFRGGRKLVIDHDDSIRSDFYDWDLLGTTHDAIGDLLERHRKLVFDTMPALLDPVCRSCPVIGYCWGGCTNSRLLTGDRPSRFCNQLGLTERVKQLAANGKLRL